MKSWPCGYDFPFSLSISLLIDVISSLGGLGDCIECFPVFMCKLVSNLLLNLQFTIKMRLQVTERVMYHFAEIILN